MGETYRRWRLPELWQMIAADDAADAHLHLTTLRRQQTALETQRDRLRTLRDQLTEAWPPEKSEAATVFVQQINDMIRAMALTANGAAAVRTNLSLIIDAIDRARAELAPLVDQYRQAASVPDQRVGQHARKLLDERARRVLMATDAAVVEPAAALEVALPAYQRISLQTEIPASPVITAGPGAGGGSAARSAFTGFPPPRFDPPAPTPGLTPDEEVHLATGRVDEAGRSPITATSGPVDGTRAAGGSLLGPGRVLGADPIRRPVGLNGPATGGAPQTRGVIGGAPAGARAGTTGVHGMAAGPRPVGGTGIARDASAENAASRRRANPDDQAESWSVPQGVAPVIEAPVTRPHDPGPGVIGIDR